MVAAYGVSLVRALNLLFLVIYFTRVKEVTPATAVTIYLWKSLTIIKKSKYLCNPAIQRSAATKNL